MGKTVCDMRGLLWALLLVLPLCNALQLSFTSPIKDIFNPGASTAQSLLATRQASMGHKHLSKPSVAGINAVQLHLGADHPELTSIVDALDSMLATLDAQDQQDTWLLNNKTADHQTTVSAARQWNATLAEKQDESVRADAACQAKTETASNDKASHEQDVQHCESELTYIRTMKDAMMSLKETGAMESVQIMRNLADKITTGSSADKAPFKNVNLLGRDYGTDSANVDAAIANLEQKINERKTAAEDAIGRITQEKDEACTAADQAADQVLLHTLRQAHAIRQEEATYSDLMTTSSIVEQSRLDTEHTRDLIAQIKSKIQELADIPSTTSIQKMPSSMLQMRMNNFDDIVETIKDLLRAIHTRIDTQASAETAAKQAKYDLYLVAKAQMDTYDLDLAVLNNNVTVLSTRLAQVTGSKDEAKNALDDEIASQLRETAMFDEMRTLLTTLAGQSTEASALATAPSKAMLALALGAERSHEDLVKRFEDLIGTLEREMQSKKSQLQVAYDGHVHDWQALSQAHAHQEATLEGVRTARQEAATEMQAAELEHETASDRLDANNIVRQQERDLITRLLAMVEQLRE